MKRHTLTLKLSLLSLAVITAILSAQAQAQESESDPTKDVTSSTGIFDQILVTAQKREQYLNDVSIAVTAFSGEQMDKLGFDDSIDLIAFTPGVSLAGDIGGQRAIFNIRGVVQNDYADIAEAPVAVYVDGGYLASTQAQTFGIFDLARVEILKGPQGTLFGRNATGGLVNTITANTCPINR